MATEISFFPAGLASEDAPGARGVYGYRFLCCHINATDEIIAWSHPVILPTPSLGNSLNPRRLAAFIHQATGSVTQFVNVNGEDTDDYKLEG